MKQDGKEITGKKRAKMPMNYSKIHERPGHHSPQIKKRMYSESLRNSGKRVARLCQIICQKKKPEKV